MHDLNFIACCVTLCGLCALPTTVHAQTQEPQAPVTMQRTPPPERRLPQQATSKLAALQGQILDEAGRPQPGVVVQLQGTDPAHPDPAHPVPPASTSGDGIFRVLRIPPGVYNMVLERPGSAPVSRPGVELRAGEVLSIEVRLPPLNLAVGTPLPQTPAETLDDTTYRELSRRPDAEGAIIAPAYEELPPAAKLAQTDPDRWQAQMPSYHRYGPGEAPYVYGHWYDPFNRNTLKADKPIFGKTFFQFTGDSILAMEGRRLPVPSGQSEANANEPDFFGRGGQFFLDQTFRLTADLFHGDTTAFRPVDWRIRVTTGASINYLDARENKVVGPDVREGTTRLDGHVGLQEAFGEVKLHDFGPDYDFANLRVGIQQFVSDFRGFLFVDEQPGVRLFGNLRSNRIQYNLAAFDFLEKNTNSGLNTFSRRGREVAIGNIYIQDFGFKGYTTQFSYHFVRDDAKLHYDDNGFLVRPAPIGDITLGRVDTHYYGWTGDGHIGRYNVDHAFYEALGDETHNEIAGERTSINAQMAAAELSRDFDWLRVRGSVLFASGDRDPRDHTATGFSSIVDGTQFAGGEFSFFNREGIPFTRAGVALTAPDSFLPDLRSSKDEGQSNFVNPGLYLYNVAVDADVTQKLRLVGNLNFLQFARTQSLDFLLQQNRLPRTIGFDPGLGAIWRPLLSDNLIVHAGATALVPGSGLRQIYTSQTLFSLFLLVRLRF